MYLLFKGKAKSHWMTGSSNNSQHHSGKEIYLNQKTYLYGHQGAQPVEMLAGDHRYRFEIDLPSGLPASMQFMNGSIEYYVEACLDIPWAFDKECRVNFSVVRKDDYNGDDRLKNASMIETTIQTSSCFSTSKPILAQISVPYSVFTPGSKIPITFNIVNTSNKDVSRIVMKFKQLISFNRWTYLL